MNIFEKYGGYEVVKQAISNYKQSGDMVTAAGLELQCLEYRREHKFYEVGDYVVLNVGSRVYKIDHIYKKSVWLDSGKESLDIVNIDDISGHATDAEIKAGRRL